MRDEFDVDQPAGDELEVPGVLVALLARDQRAHRAHIAWRCRGLARGGERRGDRRGDLVGEARVAGDDPRARQRHVLPGLRLVAPDRARRPRTASRAGPCAPTGAAAGRPRRACPPWSARSARRAGAGSAARNRARAPAAARRRIRRRRRENRRSGSGRDRRPRSSRASRACPSPAPRRGRRATLPWSRAKASATRFSSAATSASRERAIGLPGAIGVEHGRTAAGRR